MPQSEVRASALDEPGWGVVSALVAGGLLLQLTALLYAHSRSAFEPDALVINAFFNLGLALLVMHRYLRRRRHRFAAAGVSVLGRVVERRQGGDSGTGRGIVVEYTDTSGATHRVSSMGSATSAPAIGETARVFYQPGAPDDGRLEFDWKLQNTLLSVFMAVCVGVGAVGVVVELVRVALGA